MSAMNSRTAPPARERMSPRRYLVTGGLGYAGAWITSGLAATGHEVFVLSRGTDKPELKPNPVPGAENVPHSLSGLPYTLIQADLVEQSPTELAALLPEGLDAVVVVLVAAGIWDPFEDLVEGTGKCFPKN